MNKNQIKGNWEQIKAAIKKQWAELTDNDLTQAKSNLTSLYGTIQKRYGDSKEQVKKKIDDILHRYKNDTDDDSHEK